MSIILGTAAGSVLTQATKERFKSGLSGFLGGLVETGLGKLFGGDDVNVARKFSKRCGLKDPISQKARKKLKKLYPENEELQCAVARGQTPVTPSLPQKTFDVFMRSLPIPEFPVRTPPILPTTPAPVIPSIPAPEVFTPRTRGELKFTKQIPQIGATMPTLGPPGQVVVSQTGLITAVHDCNGRRVSRKKIFQMAKCTSIDAVAAAMCTTQGVVAQAIMQECTKKRRRRGITARDLATAKRVNCRIKSMARDLGVTRAPARRKTSCR